MKRYGNLYDKIISMDNLILAEKHARKGKTKTYGVRLFDRDPQGKLEALQRQLVDGTFKTSEYTTFKVYEPKERTIYRLPYYPDRIVHHAIMNIMGEIWTKTFTADQYSCIKGRGVHLCAKRIEEALRKDADGTRYCLKTDIVKFYPSIDHDCLKAIIRRKIKDDRLLTLLDGIIDSTDGVPIGNYLSQFFANLYLAYVLHGVKECGRFKGMRIYCYADDIVALAGDKTTLHALRAYLQEEYDRLRIKMKPNHQVFPIEACGLDFIGYRFYRGYTLLRKRIKKRMAKAFKRRARNAHAVDSYRGWAQHCDSKNLLKKLEKETP